MSDSDIFLPHFLWGKFLESGKGDTGYGAIAGSQYEEYFSNLRPANVIVGRPTLANNDVDAFALSYKNGNAILSHYFYQKGMAWDETDIRRFLFEHHIIFDSPEILDSVRYDLVNFIEYARTKVNFNKIYHAYEQLEQIKFRNFDKQKKINLALQRLKQNDLIGKVIQIILNRIIQNEKVFFLNTKLTLDARLQIFESVASLLPSKAVCNYSFSTHSYHKADKDIVSVRFYDDALPVDLDDPTFLDFHWLDEDIQTERKTGYLLVIEKALENFSSDFVTSLLFQYNDDTDEFAKAVNLKIAIESLMRGDNDVRHLITLFIYRQIGELKRYKELVERNLTKILLDEEIKGSVFDDILAIGIYPEKIISNIDNLKYSDKTHFLKKIWILSLSEEERHQFYNCFWSLTERGENSRNRLFAEFQFTKEDRYKFFLYLIENNISCKDDILQEVIQLCYELEFPLFTIPELSDYSPLQEAYKKLQSNESFLSELADDNYLLNNSFALTILALRNSKSNFLNDEWITLWYRGWQKEEKNNFADAWQMCEQRMSCAVLGALAWLASDDFSKLYYKSNSLGFCENKERFIDGYIQFLKGIIIESVHLDEFVDRILKLNDLLFGTREELVKWVERLTFSKIHENLQVRLMLIWGQNASGESDYKKILKYINKSEATISKEVVIKIIESILKYHVNRLCKQKPHKLSSFSWESNNARELFGIISKIQEKVTELDCFAEVAKTITFLDMVDDHILLIHQVNYRYLEKEKLVNYKKNYYQALPGDIQQILSLEIWFSEFSKQLGKYPKPEINDLKKYFQYILEKPVSPNEFVECVRDALEKLGERHCQKICAALQSVLNDEKHVLYLDQLNKKLDIPYLRLIIDISVGLELAQLRLGEMKLLGDKVGEIFQVIDNLPKSQYQQDEYSSIKGDLAEIVKSIKKAKKKLPKPEKKRLRWGKQGE